ncbi:M64 family metallopeptidase [Saccharicrinis aurantiacus]|uniref:M64 family metallopeptidase n=1 Tax=Saccharicrinis aurantiacus TaxID=1849719 RepID=UPI002491FF0E|nr:M64 family metallopeptidase [Saccharicrinis aurantiacus]
MHKALFIVILSLTTFIKPNAQFNQSFTKEALRIDFVLTGNNKSTDISIFETIKEPHWGGNHNNLICPFDYGQFRLVVKDYSSKQVLYTHGFCTLFEEWQTTIEAEENESAFFQTVQCPFPKKKVLVDIETRDEANQFKLVKTFTIDPKAHSIIERKAIAKTHKFIDNGKSTKCVDIAIIAEGYTEDEMEIFHADVERLSNYLFTQAPFDQYKNKFNIWMIDAISEESGVSDPRKDIWKNTALQASFNTLNSDRYLETTHTFTVRDYAALVPYDQIYILVNTEKYGGGGIYNHFSTTAAHHGNSEPVFVHEFGHSFAALGDEYYTSEVSYSDFFNTAVEPWQPNLTTLINFDSKWKTMLDENTPIPTPANTKQKDIIGVYEGGGYVAKGVYRPYIDCRMKTNTADGFCPVCQKAIKEMILFLTGEEL